jgi:hypothetical protein
VTMTPQNDYSRPRKSGALNRENSHKTDRQA